MSNFATARLENFVIKVLDAIGNSLPEGFNISVLSVNMGDRAADVSVRVEREADGKKEFLGGNLVSNQSRAPVRNIYEDAKDPYFLAGTIGGGYQPEPETTVGLYSCTKPEFRGPRNR